MTTTAVVSARRSRGLDYRTVWRWHFYAGVFCIPFVLWLATTGSIFVLKPQIDRFLDRPYDHLLIRSRTAPQAQVKAALAAVPASVLDSYELPHSATSATQVLVDKGQQQFRVYVQPETLQILHVVNEDHRFENVVFHLHGELLMGDFGSNLVELAASWAVVMVLTGIYLWWPRNAAGIAGVLYPRLRSDSRTFWRDIHAVTGIYVSAFALFLLLTGLPWAKGWGTYLKAWRHFADGRAVHQDWTTSSSEELAARSARSHGGPAEGGAAEHAMHSHHHGPATLGTDGFAPIDKMVPTVASLHLAEPVLISPPARKGSHWTAKSDTRDRPLRVDLVLDSATGSVIKRTDFSSRPLLDRIIGTGVAAHEGYLFGVLNQALSLFTAFGLITLCISALVMWWRRRPEGVLGALPALRPMRFSYVLLALVVALGIYMPFLGASMVLVVLLERSILRRIESTRSWLGLRA